MYKRFFINQDDVEKLTTGVTATSLWDEKEYEEWKSSLKDTLKGYIDTSSLDGSLDAEIICDKFFPEKTSLYLYRILMLIKLSLKSLQYG